MIAFGVWVRNLGGLCRFRVDGRENAQWLLDRLGESSVFKSSEPIREEANTAFCTFLVPYSSYVSHSSVARLLARLPEVNLNIEPA